MNRPWWSYVLQMCIWFIFMSFVMGYLSKKRIKSDTKKSARKLSHPTSTFFIGAFGFLFFAGITILSNLNANKTTTTLTTATFLTFTIIAMIVMADYFLARHEISSSGINFGKLSGLRGYIKWSELESVEYSRGMQWFKLNAKDGQVAHISVLLNGLPEFARLVLKNAPAASISDAARILLEDTSKGNPPQIW